LKLRLIRTALLSLTVATLALGAAPKKPAPKAPPPPPPPPTAPMQKVQEEVGDKVLGSLSLATRVQIWRVDSSGGLRPDPARAIGSDFVREATGKELAAADLAALRGLLYDEKTYRFEADVSKCNFKPDVSFHFENNLETLEALVSFGCSQVLYYAGKPGGRWLPSGTYDVKPARAALLKLSQQLLPNDAPTQKLK
jgi:hypothetical protein